jgi:putative glutamine amidotransferase
MQPIIAVTGRPKDIESVGAPMRAYTVFHTYTDGIIESGGHPIVLVPKDIAGIDSVLDRVDGVLLTGGGDINPATYGQDRHAEVSGVDDERDAYELALVREAYRRRIPTLAICRGLQIVNVAFGGTLVQDLPSERDARGHDQIGEAAWAAHSMVTIRRDSQIAELLGEGDHGVNSIHHQAVDRLGEGLRVVGHALDGTIEAVEHKDTSWPMVAVQWHPEFLRYLEDHGASALFAHLIETAGKYRADR